MLKTPFTGRRPAILPVIVAACCLPAAAGSAASAWSHPFVVGVEELVLPAGHYTLGGKSFSIAAPFSARIDPADVVSVKDEPLILRAGKPEAFFKGTQLQGVKLGGICAFRSLIGSSLELRDAAGRLLERERDYRVEERFALLGTGTDPSFNVKDTVYASYSYYRQRIDGIFLHADGSLSCVKGEPRMVSPVPPDTPAGSALIATVYRPYGADKLLPQHVFPVVETACMAPTRTTPGRINATLDKIASGEPVKIVYWGDSITVGADVAYEDGWPRQVSAALRARFPQARLEFANHSIGGSKSVQWLNNGVFPGIPDKDPQKCRFEHVLNEQPDLVIMEFINDVVLKPDVLAETYERVSREFAGRGIEWILVTPSHRIVENFDLLAMRDAEPRPLDQFIIEFAGAKGHAVADSAARWRHLHLEGIPYFSLMNNAYNHPNAFGHRLFLEEIIKCFSR